MDISRASINKEYTIETHIFRHKYRALATKHDELGLLLASDIHFDEPSFDQDLFTSDFDRAKREGSRILINGDVFGCILPGDLKRYTRGNDKGGGDGVINEALRDAEELFRPYVNQIDMIGLGNHESSVLKFHHVDVTRLLIFALSRHRDPALPPIRHGGYTGYIRYQFEGPARSQTKRFDIFYNHGQGGNAEVTDGIIDLKRRLYTHSDVIWLGHKHRRLVVDLDPAEGMADNGSIYSRKRYGVMTGCYSKATGETNATDDGYRINYGEERIRTKQRFGGVHGKIIVGRNGIGAEFVV